MTYPALSIWQPWAWLVVNGFKDVENRSRATRHRGTLLIHAGLTFDPDFDWAWAQERLKRDFGVVMPEDPNLYPRGGIVGRVRVVGCGTVGDAIPNWHRHFIDDSPWFTGGYGYALAEAKARPFRPCRGKQGFFYPDFTPPPARRGRRR